MKFRPRVLDIFCYIFLVIALSFPVQLFFAHGHSLGEVGLVLAKLTWLNYVIMALCLAAAVLVYRASQLLVVVVPILLFAVAWNNYIVGSYGYDFSLAATTLSTFGFMGFVGAIYFSPVADLIKQPAMRWWLIPKRVKAQLETCVNPYVGEEVRGQTHDISESGFFLEYSDLEEGPMNVGDLISARIKVSQTLSLQCEAKVVRRCEATGVYPSGFGLEFINLKRPQRTLLKSVVEAA